jgi:hypothetical protein
MAVEETWRDVPGYSGWYQVSNFANVRSVERDVTTRDGAVYRKRSRPLYPNQNNSVTLARNGDRWSVNRYRLAAMAFAVDELAVNVPENFLHPVKKPNDFDAEVQEFSDNPNRETLPTFLRALADLLESA